MDYHSALDYILSFADFERASRSALVFDIRRIKLLLERLENPQDAARPIHIAGTKGKGSTAAMLASILTDAGYRTGLYTSPHLLSFTERIQIDGKPIAEADFARLLPTLKPEIEYMNRLATFGELTTFELLTALAFVYFREKQVDYQVLETGLGGRLDATNVVKPEVCIITSISYDHTEVLGNTLTLIATEKAGIIKPGSTVVCAPQFPEVMAVIERICHERGVKLLKISSDVSWQSISTSLDGQNFFVKGLTGKYNLSIPLIGDYQLENAATAVTVAEVLVGSGASITPENIADGLAQVHWPGRFQVLRRKPWVIIDGAHNAYSAQKLAEALRQNFKYERIFLIFGASSDKNVAGMVAELASLPDEVIVTTSHHPRAVEPAKLVSAFSKKRVIPEVVDNVASALEIALARATPNDLICATGSLFIIAEVLEYVLKKS